MEINEGQKKILEDLELAKSLEEALDRNAGKDELASILASSGVDTEAAETLIAELQHRRGTEIGLQELDDDELDQVAGGGKGLCSGTADCDKQFKRHSEIGIDYRCECTVNCDEYLWGCCAD